MDRVCMSQREGSVQREGQGVKSDTVKGGKEGPVWEGRAWECDGKI